MNHTSRPKRLKDINNGLKQPVLKNNNVIIRSKTNVNIYNMSLKSHTRLVNYNLCQENQSTDINYEIWNGSIRYTVYFELN